jgi:hypothetical protein
VWKIALIAVSGMTLGLVLLAAPSAERPPDRPGGRLVLGLLSPERVAVVDVRTGRSVSRRLPGGTLCGSPLLVRGRRLVLPGRAHGRPAAMSLGLGLRGAARPIGRADEYFPSMTGDRLWLTTFRYGRAIDSLGSIREVSVGGRTTLSSRQHSPGASVAAALEDGLVFEGPGRTQVWDPRSGRTLRRMPEGFVLGVHDRRVAWCRGRCRSLRVTGPGGELAVTLPAATQGGAFSPDGSRVAAALAGGRIALVDLDRRSARLVPHARLGTYEAMAWDRSGRWLFFAARRRRLMAWRPGSDRPVALAVRPRDTVAELAAAG